MILCPGDACPLQSNCLHYDPTARAGRPYATEHYEPPPYDFARQSCSQFIPMTSDLHPRHRYNLKPTPPNHPLMLRRLALSVPLPINPSSDMTALLMAIRDQGQEGSCSSFSTRRHREFAHRLATGSLPPQYFSTAFGYWATRAKISGTFPQDSGASLGEEYASDEVNGCCWESDFPYGADPAAVPSDQAIADAALMKLLTSVPTPIPCRGQAGLDAIRQQLSAGQCVSFGTLVFPEIEQVGSDGIVSMPKSGDVQLGGHGLLFSGHNDASGMLMFDNSWGASWGFGGRGFFPYEYVLDGNLFEAWTLTPAA